jgi:hypothetical protein
MCMQQHMANDAWHPQVEGEQFVGAISEALEPRMRLTGEMATLQKFNVSLPEGKRLANMP